MLFELLGLSFETLSAPEKLELPLFPSRITELEELLPISIAAEVLLLGSPLLTYTCPENSALPS